MKRPNTYDFQNEIISGVYKEWDDGNHAVLLQASTGAGKTEMGIAIAHDWLELNPNGVVAWLTHREELRDQSSSRFKPYGIFTVDLLQMRGKNRKWVRGSVNLFTPQMKPIRAPRVACMLIIDEAHHSPSRTWRRAIELWPGLVLGLTATPWRLSKTEGFPMYDAIVCGPTTDDLVKMGYLAKYTISYPSQELEVAGGSIVGGDFSPDDMDDRVLGSQRIWEYWKKHAREDSQTIWFVPTVKSTILLSGVLEDNNAKFGVVTGKTPKDERREIFRAFSAKEINHLVNVVVATEGVDVPDADIGVIARATKSMTLWLQMAGRFLRLKSDGRSAKILDVGNSLIRELSGEQLAWMDWPFAYNSWTLEPRGAPPEGADPIIVKCISKECSQRMFVRVAQCIRCNQLQWNTCCECGSYFRMKSPEENNGTPTCSWCKKQSLQDAMKARGIYVEWDNHFITSQRAGNKILYAKVKDYGSSTYRAIISLKDERFPDGFRRGDGFILRMQREAPHLKFNLYRGFLISQKVREIEEAMDLAEEAVNIWRVMMLPKPAPVPIELCNIPSCTVHNHSSLTTNQL